MSYQTRTLFVATLAVTIVGGLGPVDPGWAAQAKAQQEVPSADSVSELQRRVTETQAKTKSILLPKPAPPNEPPPEDGGPAAFHFTTDQAIEMLQHRVELNPKDFTNYRYLGIMYDRKARETGDSTQFTLAEDALRTALNLLPNDPRTRSALAIVLCARHKFAEALEIAEKLSREYPRDLDALATKGDALLELGRYEEAELAYRKLHHLSKIPEVLARLANLAELTGKPEEAISLMHRAAADIPKNAIQPNADAWYFGRLADIHFNIGQIEEAAQFYESVPEGVDAYHDATAGRGRILAAQGQIDEAITFYERAIEIGPDPHMLAALGDLYKRLGNDQKASEIYAQFLEETEDDPESYRERSMFLADHDRDLTEALRLARLDFEQRQDVFAWETLAWSLHKNGQDEDAAEAIAEALKTGIRDARIHFHAGVIRHALGDPAGAREHLSTALEINPHFSPSKAEQARELLKSLDE
ncbi:hypothetical protein BH23PLA1_BH23PLA1_11790 [soil metagenome]